MDSSLTGSSVHGILQARILVDVASKILWICFKTANSNNSLIIAVPAGNQTQVLPQCDSLSEPADSASSEESAPYCSGEGPTGQKTLSIVPHCPISPSSPLSHFSLRRQQTAPPGGRGRSLRRESGDPWAGLLGHHLWWRLGPGRCPRGVQAAGLWRSPKRHEVCSLRGGIRAHLAGRPELHRKGVPRVEVPFPGLGAAWLQTQGGRGGRLLRSVLHAVHRLGDGVGPWRTGVWALIKVKPLSRVRLFATPWTVVYLASPSMGFSRPEYWSGLPLPSLGDLPKPGIEPKSPALRADSILSEPPGALMERC